jgi:uncharacterized phiE125 gp8 family phage protein
MGLYLKTPPKWEPITLDEAKAHVRVTHNDDDVYIAHLISTARAYAEQYLKWAIPEQTWVWTMDEWPVFPVRVPKCPLSAVVSFTYKTADGAQVVVDPASYIVDTNSLPGRIYYEPPGVTLPEINGITIEFVAGFASASDVPMAIKHAMLLIIGHWYENREQVTTERLATVPFGVEALLDPLRMWTL